MNRRKFLSWTALLALASATPISLTQSLQPDALARTNTKEWWKAKLRQELGTVQERHLDVVRGKCNDRGYQIADVGTTFGGKGLHTDDQLDAITKPGSYVIFFMRVELPPTEGIPEVNFIIDKIPIQVV